MKNVNFYCEAQCVTHTFFQNLQVELTYFIYSIFTIFPLVFLFHCIDFQNDVGKNPIF